MNLKTNKTIVGILTLSALWSCTTQDTDIIEPDENNPVGNTGILGSGTDGDPLQITTPAHLDSVMRDEVLLSYKLMNDIDLTDYIASKYSTEGWLPIENFSGKLDGDDFTISGLTINRPDIDNTGFFGTIGTNDNNVATIIEIKNLKIEVGSVGITGKTRVGALIGFANDGIIISNIHISGINNDSYILSTDETLATDNGRSGGMIGLAERSTISRCSSSIKVVSSGGGRIGGLIGMTNTSTVDQCYATGDVYGKFEDVGGLIGFAFNDGSAITNSYATGNVFIDAVSSDDIGGFVGATSSTVTLSNCYSLGNVTLKGSTDGYGAFSGDGDGGVALFGSTSQTIVDGDGNDISSGAVTENSGYKLINLASFTCADFSDLDASIWTCIDGNFPSLTNNP